MNREQKNETVEDKIEAIEALQLKDERYIGDTIQMLWDMYYSKGIDSRLKAAVKKKYNELVVAENSRTGLETKFHYKTL